MYRKSPTAAPATRKRTPRAWCAAAGFTLMELMITVAIAGILLMIAVPAFDELIRSNRLTTEANGFVTAVHTARAEAARLRGPVSLRPRGGGGDWAAADALEVWAEARPFQDLNRDGDFLDANETLPAATLKLFPPFSDTTEIGPEGVATLLTFQPNGLVQTGNAQLEICDPGSPNCRRITVTTAGRVSVAEFARAEEEEEE